MVRVRYSVPHEYRPHREHRSKRNKKYIGGRDGKLWKLRRKKKIEELKLKDLEDY